MSDSFDAAEFAHYLKLRWRTIAVCCGVAVLAALSGSLVVAKRYTAVSTLLIEPPAGMDPRGATAVSPVYLESLRTYEVLASSDSLFQQALDHFHLREEYAGRSIESLKRSVLEVSKPVSTRVIQIRVTLKSPKEAQALAQYLAEQTVALNRALDTRSTAEVSRETQTIFEEARERLASAQRAADEFSAKHADGSVAAELDSASDLKFQVTRDLGKARAELADFLSRPQGETAREIASARARIASLEAQEAGLAKTIAEKGNLSERLSRRQEFLAAEVKSARSAFDAARAKLDELKASVAFHGERLEVLDPGIVPQRPSWPNTPLNVLAALLVSSVAAVLWLAARFGYERPRTGRPDRTYSLR